MLLIGITGSIATGKSTASRLLASPPHNLPVIDADALARAVVRPGMPALRRLVAYFGASAPDLLHADGTLNRPALARRVFGAGEVQRRDRAAVNGIIHPAVRWEMYKLIARYYLRGHWAVVLDLPLLFESRLDVLCGAVIVVGVTSREVQLDRMLARDRLVAGAQTREEAERRVASQMPLAEKVALCEGLYGCRGRGEVVLNDAGIDELGGELARVLARWRAERRGWWLWLVGPAVGVWLLARNLWGRWRWEVQRGEAKAKL